MAREYRSRNRILLDILRAVKAEPNIGTTRLLFLSNLSHERFQEHVGEAVTRGLVAELVNSERRTYALTEKGQRVLAELDRVERFMADFGMNL